MIRKLFSTMLCALALLLLMGAAEVPESAELILAQEESAAADGSAALETDSEIQFEVNDVSTKDEKSEDAESDDEKSEDADEDKKKRKNKKSKDEEPEVEVEEVVEVTTDALVLIDGQPAPIEINRIQHNNTTYVSLAGMAKALDESAVAVWNGGSATVTVTTANLTLTARMGDLYVVANGRYLYVPEQVSQLNGTVMLPLSVIAKAFDAKLSWDAATGMIHIQRGTGALVSGDEFYNQDDLFWMSRVIMAESGNQPMEGRMAVGNVVLNRLNNPIFPNTIQGVLAQRNQFSTYKGGRLANRTPNEGSIIAAKLVLDGGVVEEVKDALWFDSLRGNSWAGRNRELKATIGGHMFYGY